MPSILAARTPREFLNQNHTRYICLLVSLWFRSSHQRLPQMVCELRNRDTSVQRIMAGGLGIRALMQNLQSALGVIALIAFAWAISENRRAVSPRRVATGLAITLVLAVLFLKVPPITAALGSANHVIDAIAEASRAGTAFVFGYIGGGPLPFELNFPRNQFVAAFYSLPLLLVF